MSPASCGLLPLSLSLSASVGIVFSVLQKPRLSSTAAVRPTIGLLMVSRPAGQFRHTPTVATQQRQPNNRSGSVWVRWHWWRGGSGLSCLALNCSYPHRSVPSPDRADVDPLMRRCADRQMVRSRHLERRCVAIFKWPWPPIGAPFEISRNKHRAYRA